MVQPSHPPQQPHLTPPDILYVYTRLWLLHGHGNLEKLENNPGSGVGDVGVPWALPHRAINSAQRLSRLIVNTGVVVYA